jgi:hypothetical protein
VKQGQYKEDPIAYRIAYSRVAQLLHLETGAQDGKPPGDRVSKLVPELVRSEPVQSGEEVARAALLEALTLIDRTRNELVSLGFSWVGWSPSRARRMRKRLSGERYRLGEFLDQTLEPSIVVLYFSARIEWFGPDPQLLTPPDLERSPLDRRKVASPSQKAKPDDTDAYSWLHSYLSYLLTTPAKGGRESPRGLGWKERGRVNPRVRYNLACMYSRLGAALRAEGADPANPDLAKGEQAHRAFVSAADQLKSSIAEAREPERMAMATWAPVDPALDALESWSKPIFDDALAGALIPGDVI